MNVFVRYLEVVVDGLPSFRGAQLAIDTTLVCPLTRELKTVHHWNEPAHGKRGAIQNSWVQKAGPGWWCLGVKLVEGSLMR